MIRLTVNPESESTVLTFNKNTVIIGAGPEGQADVLLKNEVLQNEHVKILDLDGHYIAINSANDPFVTLNGLPFHKKPLKNNDIFQIGKTTIRFENELTSSATEEIQKREIDKKSSVLYDTQEKLPKVLEEVMTSKQSRQSDQKSSSFSKEEPKNSQKDIFEQEFKWAEEGLYPEHEMEDDLYQMEKMAQEIENSGLKEQKLPDMDIEAMMQEVERLEMIGDHADHEETIIMDPKEKPLPLLNKPKISGNQPLEYDPHLNPAPFQISPSRKPTLKDYYLSEFDDENESWKMEKDGRSDESYNEAKSNWRLIGAVIFVILLIIGIVLGVVYFSLSGKSGREELQAAEDVADVTMALAYAQIHHINPHKQNWSDPDFLRNNLTAVLTPNYPSPANIDAHGQFNNCPYILRIYTSNDLSQFLVIAQPAPSLLHWLIPKSSIIVDSRMMELRKFNDLKTLNRLLVNTNTLDGSNAMEVSNLAKQGELIPLASLASRNDNQDFATPPALGFIRPGAENRIYNAPRYYYFGETILKNAVTLSETPSSSHEVALLKQQMEPFSKFSDLVLYSSRGMQSAMQAQKALSTFAPKDKFLIAYLVFNTKGLVSSSHLLIDEESSQAAILGVNKDSKDDSPEKKMIQTLAYALESVQKVKVEPPSKASEKEITLEAGLESGHPLYLQLTALGSARQQELKHISEEINALLDRQNHGIVDNFQSEFESLSSKYEEKDREEQSKISQNLAQLYQEYSSLPLSEFMGYVKAADLEPFMQAYLRSQQKNDGRMPLSDNLIESHLYQIQHSRSLEELAINVRKTAAIMTLEKIPDANKLIAYQKKMRTSVLETLRKLLFSSNSPVPKDYFTLDNRTRLSEILRSSWVSNPDEHDYYMNEFDILAEGNAEQRR